MRLNLTRLYLAPLLVVGASALIACDEDSASKVLLELQPSTPVVLDDGKVSTFQFELKPSPSEALWLDFYFSGANYEQPPLVRLNEKAVATPAQVQALFPSISGASWQLNPDGSHDFNGEVFASFEITPLVKSGSNTLLFSGGRSDDRWSFRTASLRSTPTTSGSSGSGGAGSSSSGTVDLATCRSTAMQPYGDIQLDANCQVACAYASDGLVSECNSTCEAYSQFAQELTGSVKPCPICSTCR